MARLDASKLVYVVSIGLHVIGGVALAAINVPKPKELEVIEMQTVELPKPPKPPEPPKPPTEAAPKPTAPRPAVPPPETAAPPPPPDFGFALGAADGPGGIAVAAVAAPVAPPVRQATKKLVAAAPEATTSCAEPETKPKASSMPRPTYTDEARAAGVEGKVRVELTVDEQGAVTAARVLEGLGHGLDEAAVEAVRGASFAPATRCGKPVAATFTVAIRFAL